MLPVIGLFINQRSFRAATLYFQTTVLPFFASFCLHLPLACNRYQLALDDIQAEYLKLVPICVLTNCSASCHSCLPCPPAWELLRRPLPHFGAKLLRRFCDVANLLQHIEAILQLLHNSATKAPCMFDMCTVLAHYA